MLVGFFPADRLASDERPVRALHYLPSLLLKGWGVLRPSHLSSSWSAAVLASWKWHWCRLVWSFLLFPFSQVFLRFSFVRYGRSAFADLVESALFRLSTDVERLDSLAFYNSCIPSNCWSGFFFGGVEGWAFSDPANLVCTCDKIWTLPLLLHHLT